MKDFLSNRPDQPFMFSVEQMEQLNTNELDFEETGVSFYIDHDS